MDFVTLRPTEKARQALEQQLKESACTITGLPTITTQSFFLSASSLAEETALWLCRSPQEREQLFALLRFWFDRLDGKNIPALLSFSNTTVAGRDFSTRLLEAVNGTHTWFLATTGDLRIPLPTPEMLQKTVMRIRAGQTLAPGAFTQEIIQNGYELSDFVREPGMVSRRGGVVDVWPFTSDDPIRLDILDQRLQKLTTFNWKTQRNRDELSDVQLPPCQLPKANRATLVTYLETMRQTVHALSPEAIEIETLDPDSHTVLRQLEHFHRITFLPFAEADTVFDFQSAPLFHRDFDQLEKYLQERDAWQCWLLTTRGYEVRERLHDMRLKKHILDVTPDESELVHGFESEKHTTVLLTDWEIFGQEESRQTRRSERADIVFVAEMQPGDFVVHIDHGIGRFTGMTEQAVNAVRREYFVLAYAEDDKLFVPVEMADKLSKYIGVASPKLHRLSGSGWYQMTKKIKEETRATAEELLKLYAVRETVKTTAFGPPTPQEKELTASFPYETTPDQQKAIADVEHDLRHTTPMDRLICGDVGFGKTEVAIRAAFKAVMNKKQVAILSPTTILTQQHYDTFRERLAQFNITIDSLSRFRTTKQQHEALDKLRLGQTDIIIGTHRLLQRDVHFQDLGLVIIDEEQRFGVEDKERLKTLRLQAHVLTLTATPIPRTLNFALAGIRNITVIETPPEGRKPIETHIEPYHDRIVQRALEKELERKGQAYFVYNNVETIALRTRELQDLVPKARFGIAHGQMPEDQLAHVMETFDRHEIDVLVCSTIIENGLDLPNVNTMIVDQATQFGLAQLYQLRGRIGRGQNQAYSYFLYHAKKLTPEARKRLQALLEARELGSGFQLALRDLEIRGTGSILGKKQHGHVSAVGLTLYSRLLAETIRELRDGITTSDREIMIDLPVTIRIPKEIEPNEQKRLSYYQKLALESTVEAVEARAQRLFRRKQFPEPIQNLVDVLKLKILAQPANVTSITFRKGLSANDPGSARVLIDFAESLIPSQIKALIDANGEWQFGENQIKISLGALGKEWIKALQDTLRMIVESKKAVYEKKVSS